MDVFNKLGGLSPKNFAHLANAARQWMSSPSDGLGPELSRDDAVRMIRASGVLDEALYKETYADVRAAGADPVAHWVDFGAREGRDPTAPGRPNQEVYRILYRYWYSTTLAEPEPRVPASQQVFPSTKQPKIEHPKLFEMLHLQFSPLHSSDDSHNYTEIAPEVQSAPISPSFIFGSFPEILARTYFSDLTTLSVGCYTLKNVGVTSHGLLVRDGQFLTCPQLDLSEESIREAGAYGELHAGSRFSRVFDEVIVSLAGPGHLIYGHWLVDFLPKLYILKEYGIDPLKAKYLLPANTPQFARSLLNILGIPEQQFIFFEPYTELIGARHLVAPTLLRTTASRVHPSFRRAAEYMRSLMPPGVTSADEGRIARLYLARGRDGQENRKLLNRQAIEKIAADRGYSVVRPETLSLMDQIKLFSRAQSIVGEYGSALHGSLFAPAGTMVCALRANAYHPGFLQSGLCQTLDQKIGYVFGATDWHAVKQEFSISGEDFKTALTLVNLTGLE